MNDKKLTRYTAEELEKRRQQGVDTGTDWERVNALSDEDIFKAVEEDPDAAPLMDFLADRSMTSRTFTFDKVKEQLGLNEK